MIFDFHDLLAASPPSPGRTRYRQHVTFADHSLVSEAAGQPKLEPLVSDRDCDSWQDETWPESQHNTGGKIAITAPQSPSDGDDVNLDSRPPANSWRSCATERTLMISVTTAKNVSRSGQSYFERWWQSLRPSRNTFSAAPGYLTCAIARIPKRSRAGESCLVPDLPRV